MIVGDEMRHSEARRLKGEIAKQLAALGEKLYESGFGPADLRERIVNKDEAIQQAEASKASTKALAKRRQALLAEMAECAGGKDHRLFISREPASSLHGSRGQREA